MEVAEGMAVLETGAAEEEGGRKAEVIYIMIIDMILHHDVIVRELTTSRTCS